MLRKLSTVMCCALSVLGSRAVFAQAAADSAPLLSTGITGMLSASGMESPTYALSFRPVQRLILEITRGPLDSTRASAALSGSPVSVSDLVRLGLIRRDGPRYRLAYLVLTTEDQRTIYNVAARYGADLASVIKSHREDFARLVARYPDSSLRSEMMFDLVGGMLLNWEGLKLNTRLGYRVDAVRHPNGDAYLVHSAEPAPRLPLEGLYWGSESWPTKTATFTTFGDARSFPRDRGIPNVFDGVFDDRFASMRGSPALYAAVRQQLLTYVSISMGDLGAVMLTLREGRTARTTLHDRLQLPADRFAAAEQLLLAIGYVRSSADSLQLNVPVLSAADDSLVQGTLTLGRGMLEDWLGRNMAPMRQSLAGLTPMRNGLPFELVFSEVWHYVFGFTTKELAESGFYANPRGSESRRVGYVPLVWASSLYTF